jgi:hypothetical protein
MHEMRFELMNGSRSRSGSSMIELPFVLWTLFLGLLVPMICLATIGIRYTFFLNASRQAVHVAAQAKSFSQDFSPNLSAQTLAQQTATACCKGFSGVTLNAVNTSIVITPVQPGSPQIQQPTKLSSPADEENFLYQIQVQLIGQSDPFIPLPQGVFGFKIPGLTDPYPIQTTAKEPSENTQGLNQ